MKLFRQKEEINTNKSFEIWQEFLSVKGSQHPIQPAAIASMVKEQGR